MTPAGQQQAFEETRARIQKNLAQIAQLARSRIEPAAFFGRFASLAADSVGAMGAAVWTVESAGMRNIAALRFETSGFDGDPRQKRWIEVVLHQCAKDAKPYVVGARDPAAVLPEGKASEDVVANTVPHPFFYQPIMAGERATGVLQVWLPAAGDPRTYSDIASFLALVCGHAENYLRGWQAGALAEKHQQSQTMLQYQGELLGSLEPQTLQNTAANYAVDLLRADLACVFRKKGRRWILVSASNQEVVDARAVHSRALSEVARHLPEESSAAVLDGSDTSDARLAPPLAEALSGAGLLRVAWRHLRSSKNGPLDRLLVAGRTTPDGFVSSAPEVLEWAAGQLAKALDAATHFHNIPLRPFASAAGRITRAWRQNRRQKIFFFVVLPVLVLAGILAMPYPWKISADCEIVPIRKAAVVAETSGKITGVFVREGTRIPAGGLVAKIDDTDHLTQLAVSNQQLLRWRVEASRAQSLGNEAERKIAEISALREEEAIRRLEFLRSRTELKSPIEGVVLTRGLEHREGEAVEAGKIFCEIAGTQGYEVQLDIRQSDLGVVLRDLHGGRAIPVQFILHAHPAQPLATTLDGADRVSQIPETRKTSSVFVAKAPFPEGSALDGQLKPGYTGKAKLAIGMRPLAFIWLRPFGDYLRTHWGL
jgi:biotin carboxyl carrier protein